LCRLKPLTCGAKPLFYVPKTLKKYH